MNLQIYKDLLLQFVLITFPIFVYYALLKGTSVKSIHKVIFGLVCCISIYLVMDNPVSFAKGNIMDLRTTPWILSFLYGGNAVGIATTVLMFIYRILLGGKGIYVVFIACSLTLPAIFIYLRNYHKLAYSGKVIRTMLIVLINLILVVSLVQLFFQFQITLDRLSFSLFFIATNVITTWITIFIIESLRENEEIITELYRSDKLKAIGQMAASIAHEIRNPLTIVRGFLQIMRNNDQVPTEKTKQYLDIMIIEIDRAEYIIKEYLLAAKPEVYTVEDVNLSQLITRTVELLTTVATIYNVEISPSVTHEQLIVRCNYKKLQQVIINIMKNAIEAAPAGGIVHIAVYKQNSTAVIDMIDNGVGMDQEQVERLGTAFYSTKEKGTGLGLMVCYQIVKSLKGKISVES